MRAGRWLLWAGVCHWALSAALPVRADEEGAQLQALIDRVSPCICTVKAVLKTEYKMGGQFQDSEARLTLNGVVVDPQGIVMLSNMPFSPGRALELMGAGAPGGEGFSMKATASGFKVTFQKEDREYDAFLAATDTKLDLAFIKVEGLADRKLPAVDFSASSDVGIGHRVAAVSRLRKGYDYAPYIQTGRVIAEISKPRRAWMLEGGVSDLGLPIFTLAGQTVGVLSTIPAAGKDETREDSMSFAMFTRLFSGGGAALGGAFVVPGASIKLVVDQARQRAEAMAVERAKRKPEPAVPPTQPVKKPPAPSSGKSKKP